MSIETGSKLWKDHATGICLLPSDEKCIEQYTFMQNALFNAGYTQYEVSSFSKGENKSKHNSSYWNKTPYLGLGPGAHSFDGESIRSYNEEDRRAHV